MSDEEYQALLEVSRQVDWRFHVAFVLAHETGHRIGAIRHLRWSDLDLEVGIIRWRAEHEKTGYEHRTPVTAEALAVLEEAARRRPGLEDAPLLPTPTDRSRCLGRSLVPVRKLLRRCHYWRNGDGRDGESGGMGSGKRLSLAIDNGCADARGVADACKTGTAAESFRCRIS